MSSTATSYVDDGRSFARRAPPASSHANVSRWLNTTTTPSETASVYTGSYIDDGLDLVPTDAAGFGPVNPRFYKQPKRRDSEDSVWNEDIARAISGDVHRSLAKMRGFAGVEVKRAEASAKQEKERRERKKGVVTVPAPLKWGTFVIKGDDGRVVVIDDRGEYDSGTVEQTLEAPVEGKRWVKAARSPSPPACVLLPPGEDNITRSSTKKEKSRSRRDSKVKTSRSSAKGRRRPIALSPVPESEHSTSHPVKPSPASPTQFFMTGGLGEWPSPTIASRPPSLSPPSPIVPHAITWDNSTSPPAHDTRTASRSRSKSGQYSIHTLPHGWPSPPASPTKSVCSSTFTYLKAASSRQPHSQSGKETRSRQTGHGYNDEREEARSNYQPADIIEVTYDETPPGEVSYSQAGWGDKPVSARSLDDVDKDGKSEGGAWDGVENGSVRSFGRGGAGSDLGWDGSAKKGGLESDGAGSKLYSVHSWRNDERHSKDGDEWDGFERPKTTSEVSVAGGSECSWPASQHSVHTRVSHHTHRSQTSRRSSRQSPADWPGSRANSKVGSAVQWTGSGIQSEQNWPADVHGSEHSKQSNHTWSRSEKRSPTEYKNGFDEDNATYLNETWGGVPVRVASPHRSVAGWD